MAVKHREAGPDALRVISFIAIVILHTNSRGGFESSIPIGFFVDELSRFAVPCFFILSAYYWPTTIEPRALFLKVLNRVWPAFAFWLLVYSAAGYLGLADPTLQGRLPSPLWILTGGAGYHLWFLPALVIGTAIASLLLQMPVKIALLCAIALLVVGILIGAYSIPLSGIRTPTVVFRNGLFFAPFFLIIGVLLKAGSHKSAHWGLLVLAIVIFGAAQVAEGLLTQRYPSGHDLGFATAGFAVAVSALFVKWRSASATLATLGGASFGAYLVHVLLLEAALRTSFAHYPMIVVPLVVIVSFAISLALRPVLSKMRLERVLA